MKRGIINILLLFFLCHVILRVSGSIEDMTRLMGDIFANYSREIRPVRNQSDQLMINTSFFLLSIRDVDEVAGSISLTGGLIMVWEDFRLSWQPEEYGGIEQILVNSSSVWSPNIFLLSPAADMEKLDLKDFDVRIYYVGVLLVNPGKLIKSTCKVDMTNFPTDYQTCNIFFVPWSYMPSEVQLTFLEPSVDINSYNENGEWAINGTSASIYKTDHYDTNAAVYTLVLKRRSAYFIISMVVPVYILCFLNPFVFLLPASSGERISYTITMFLSLAVYMTLVGDNMPKVSEPMAGISYFLLVSMAFSCALTILTIFTLRWHARKDPNQFPKLLKHLVFLCTRKEEKRRTAKQENESSSDLNVGHLYHISKASKTQDQGEITCDLDISSDPNIEDITAFIDNALFWISELVVTGLVFGFTYGYHR
ncbi:neuronal acetylcholine receptor subunit alpha-3-like [Argopecten irradians]|uniref:neuronal acetylcholine receptor subunit alpha-3-like n=1 Tax=Argopecten irradians TaxID=31199 RepID=UPI00371D773C